MADKSINCDFGDVYLATNAKDAKNLNEIMELYLLVVRDPKKTIRLHGKIYLSQLEDGQKPPVKYCVNVIKGKFVDLASEPDGANPDEVEKHLKLISRLSEEQKIFFKEILEEMELRAPGKLKYNED